MTKSERRKLIRAIIKKAMIIIWKSGWKAGEIYLNKELEKLSGKF